MAEDGDDVMTRAIALTAGTAINLAMGPDDFDWNKGFDDAYWKNGFDTAYIFEEEGVDDEHDEE